MCRTIVRLTYNNGDSRSQFINIVTISLSVCLDFIETANTYFDLESGLFFSKILS